MGRLRLGNRRRRRERGAGERGLRRRGGSGGAALRLGRRAQGEEALKRAQEPKEEAEEIPRGAR